MKTLRFDRYKLIQYMMAIYVAVLASAVAAGCTHLPPGYSAQAQRATNAHQLLQELTALSQTVIGLNGLPANAPGKMTDADTALVRDVVLAISDSMTDYVANGSLKSVQAAVDRLSRNLSTNARLSPTFRTSMALVNTQLQLIGVVLGSEGGK